MTASSASPAPSPAAEGRSPFVRLHELLADIEPGKPAINLSVGEPQHPIPAVRRPGACRRISPISAAIRPTRAPTASARPPPPGSAAATSCRAPVDPETEVLVLNGTREGLFLGALAAKRYVGDRAGQAGDPDPQSVLRRLLGRRRRRRLRAGLSAGHARKPASCPISTRSTRRCSRAPSPSISPRRRIRRARSPTRAYLDAARRAGAPLRLPDLRRRVLFGDLSATDSRRRHAAKSSGPDFANVVVFHSLSKRSNLPGLRVGFAAGDRRFLGRFLELRNIAAPQVPVPAQEVADRRLRRRSACRGEPRALRRRNSISPTRSSATATATSARPAASFSGSTSRAHGGDEAVDRETVARGGLRVMPGQLSRARRRRRPQSRRGLHPRRHGAGQAKPPPRRCIASSPCSDKQV